MQSNLAVIWLLVSGVIFIYFAGPFDRASPRRPIWLLVLAASWPLLVSFMAISALVTLVCLPMSQHRNE